MVRSRNQLSSECKTGTMKTKTNTLVDKDESSCEEQATQPAPRGVRNTRRSTLLIQEKSDKEIKKMESNPSPSNRLRQRGRPRKSDQILNRHNLSVENEALPVTDINSMNTGNSGSIESEGFINNEEIYLDNINNIENVVEISDFGQNSNTLIVGSDNEDKQIITLPNKLTAFESGSFTLSSPDEDSQSQSDEDSSNRERESPSKSSAAAISHDNEILLEICTDQTVKINSNLFAFASPPHTTKQSDDSSNENKLESDQRGSPKRKVNSIDSPITDRAVSSPEVFHARSNTKAPRTYQNRRKTRLMSAVIGEQKLRHCSNELKVCGVESSNFESQDKSNIVQEKLSHRPAASMTECRRSQRNRIIKYDVRDLLNKNRKSKIHIETKVTLKPKSPTLSDFTSKENNYEGYATDGSSSVESLQVFKGFSDSSSPKLPPTSVKEKNSNFDSKPLEYDFKIAQKKEISVQTVNCEENELTVNSLEKSQKLFQVEREYMNEGTSSHKIEEPSLIKTDEEIKNDNKEVQNPETSHKDLRKPFKKTMLLNLSRKLSRFNSDESTKQSTVKEVPVDENVNENISISSKYTSHNEIQVKDSAKSELPVSVEVISLIDDSSTDSVTDSVFKNKVVTKSSTVGEEDNANTSIEKIKIIKESSAPNSPEVLLSIKVNKCNKANLESAVAAFVATEFTVPSNKVDPIPNLDCSKNVPPSKWVENDESVILIASDEGDSADSLNSNSEHRNPRALKTLIDCREENEANILVSQNKVQHKDTPNECPESILEDFHYSHNKYSENKSEVIVIPDIEDEADAKNKYVSEKNDTFSNSEKSSIIKESSEKEKAIPIGSSLKEANVCLTEPIVTDVKNTEVGDNGEYCMKQSFDLPKAMSSSEHGQSTDISKEVMNNDQFERKETTDIEKNTLNALIPGEQLQITGLSNCIQVFNNDSIQISEESNKLPLKNIEVCQANYKSVVQKDSKEEELVHKEDEIPKNAPADDISKNNTAQICNKLVKSRQKDKTSETVENEYPELVSTKTNCVNNKKESNADLILSEKPTMEKKKFSGKKGVRLKRKESQEKNKEPITINDVTNLHCDGNKSSTYLNDISSRDERPSEVVDEKKSHEFSKKEDQIQREINVEIFQKKSDEVEKSDSRKKCEKGISKASVLSVKNVRSENTDKHFISDSLKSDNKQSKVLKSDIEMQKDEEKTPYLEEPLKESTEIVKSNNVSDYKKSVPNNSFVSPLYMKLEKSRYVEDLDKDKKTNKKNKSIQKHEKSKNADNLKKIVSKEETERILSSVYCPQKAPSVDDIVKQLSKKYQKDDTVLSKHEKKTKNHRSEIKEGKSSQDEQRASHKNSYYEHDKKSHQKHSKHDKTKHDTYKKDKKDYRTDKDGEMEYTESSKSRKSCERDYFSNRHQSKYEKSKESSKKDKKHDKRRRDGTPKREKSSKTSKDFYDKKDRSKNKHRKPYDSKSAVDSDLEQNEARETTLNKELVLKKELTLSADIQPQLEEIITHDVKSESKDVNTVTNIINIEEHTHSNEAIVFKPATEEHITDTNARPSEYLPDENYCSDPVPKDDSQCLATEGHINLGEDSQEPGNFQHETRNKEVIIPKPRLKRSRWNSIINVSDNLKQSQFENDDFNIKKERLEDEDDEECPEISEIFRTGYNDEEDSSPEQEHEHLEIEENEQEGFPKLDLENTPVDGEAIYTTAFKSGAMISKAALKIYPAYLNFNEANPSIASYNLNCIGDSATNMYIKSDNLGDDFLSPWRSEPYAFPQCDIGKSDSCPRIEEEKDFPKDESDDFQDSSSQYIRRSHRIKTISKAKQCVGRGLVKDRERFLDNDDKNQSCATIFELEAENEKFLKDMEERLSQFQVIKENEYRCDRIISKEAKKMICDCFLTRDEEERGELGCGEDCLNRLLMIECGPKCVVADRCTNKRFQKNFYSHCKVFRTEKKGFGIMADGEILSGEFIMEYVGEVLNDHQFRQRAETYSKDKNKHYYFMALRSDAIIDATVKGNISRFINHSCDPNAETQKWTVNGELRIGFFSKRKIYPGEEITFDYQFQRYGKEAQKCYCESANCRGWIGEEPDSDEEYEDEDDGISEEDEERDRTGADLEKKSSDISDKSSDLDASSIIYGDLREDVEDGNESPISSTTPVRGKAGTRESKKSKQRKEFHLGKKSQFLEDQDVEDEIEFLTLTGLKNQAHTLRLSRLMVRAKMLDTRIRLLEILRGGELPCRRLFLDYHGLRLLHGWMNENEIKDSEASLRVRLLILQTLEILPIPNKTLLKESKVFYTITSWAEEKEVHSSSPNADSPTDNGSATLISVADLEGKKGNESAPVIPQAVQALKTEISQISKKLLIAWEDLPEVFRIPKRERIEQMKEHEREADRQYKTLNIADEDESKLSSKYRGERFCKSSKAKEIKTKWTRERDEKERDVDADGSLTKVQRRQLFAARVAKDAEERRRADVRRDFEQKCKFYGIDPMSIQPRDIPFCVNPATGQWYTNDKRKIETPPSHAHINVPQIPMSTDPSDYHLPPMDLPPLWRFAIDIKGRLYYYHVKIRIPQWEPPIKIEPLTGGDESDEEQQCSSYDSAALVDTNDNNEELNSDSFDSDESVSETKIRKIETANDPANEPGTEPANEPANEAVTEPANEPVIDSMKQNYYELQDHKKKKRYNMLVQEKPISPRREEDRIYNQIEMKRYKENKEKIRKRREELKRKKTNLTKEHCTASATSASEEFAQSSDGVPLPIQDYLFSSDEEDYIRTSTCDGSLLGKFVQGDKIVDELDALKKERPLKRSLPIKTKHETKKRLKVEDRKRPEDLKISKDVKRSNRQNNSKYQARKAKEKFRSDISGIIVQHLTPYRKESCLIGKIASNDDFKHLARKLTHFVMVKELKHCDSTGQILEVTESVKNKSREFIKKYMAKYGETYVRPDNDPEFKDIPHND